MSRSVDCVPQPNNQSPLLTLTEEQRTFLTYWRSKTKDGTLPKRADIDPLEIPKLLPNISLVDVLLDQNPVVYRARLLGTEITRHFGRDVTGKVAKQLYDEHYLLQLETTYSQILEVRQPVLCKCQVPLKDGNITVYHRFIAPLSTNGTEIDMLMSHFCFPGNFPATNRHLPQAKSIWETVPYGESLSLHMATA